MYQIARNEAVREANRRRRRTVQSLPDEDFLTDSGDAGQRNDEVELIRVALERLDVASRELVELKIYGGLTFREIADVVGSPQAAVATRYRRALESLRGWLTRQVR
jgi:RNA polymerase sigma-70 factor (ECF subfamily)